MLKRIWLTSNFHISTFNIQVRGAMPMKTLENESVKNFIPTDFPGGSVVKNLPANAGDTGSSPGPGRSHVQQSN